MTRLECALTEIRAARQYTQRLIDDLRDDEWFRQPTEGVTHIAWQVGHLAMAHYRLLLERVRGERPTDGALISTEFLTQFGKGSTPSAQAAAYPSMTQIRATFDRLHRQALEELSQLRDEQLDEPPIKGHPLFNTKFGSLCWCARHEMLHAGQIGLVRRLIGRAAQW